MAAVILLGTAGVAERETRAGDPLFPQQWHLEGATLSVRASNAWAMADGSGVQVAVVDDGLQHSHPDLTSNYVAADSYDYNGGDNDPSPNVASDYHGTAASGVAAASNDDGTCGSGIAPQASLAGLRLISVASTDAQEAAAETFHTDKNMVFSNSWGPPDDARGLNGPGPLLRSAFVDGVKNGRNGRGSVYVWAAGNGREQGDNCNYDGYASSIYTIAVGAVGQSGQVSYYSEPCAAMVVTAPSSGIEGGITTTDLVGPYGYDGTSCTHTFGGTSSSCPLVAGVVALMLQQRPSLTWRDVQHVLIHSADSSAVGAPNGAGWVRNGAGLYVHHDYGFGTVRADTAATLAGTWTLVQPLHKYQASTSPRLTIPDSSAAGVTSTITAPEVPSDFRLEHTVVVLDIRHNYRGDLRIQLTSPSGTTSILAEPHPDGGQDYPDWEMMTVHNWDETANGKWALKISDEESGDEGSLQSWTLILYGRSADPVPNDPYEGSGGSGDGGDGGNGLSTGAVVGIVISLTVVLLGVSSALFILVRKRSYRGQVTRSTVPPTQSQQRLDPTAQAHAPPPYRPAPLMAPPPLPPTAPPPYRPVAPPPLPPTAPPPGSMLPPGTMSVKERGRLFSRP